MSEQLIGCNGSFHRYHRAGPQPHKKKNSSNFDINYTTWGNGPSARCCTRSLPSDQQLYKCKSRKKKQTVKWKRLRFCNCYFSVCFCFVCSTPITRLFFKKRPSLRGHVHISPLKNTTLAGEQTCCEGHTHTHTPSQTVHYWTNSSWNVACSIK